MDERFKPYAFAFLAARALIDLALAGISYFQEGTLAFSLAFLPVCCVFYLLLFFGLRNGEFRGRYGHRVALRRESVGYWFVVAFVVLFHLCVTVAFARLLRW